MKIQANQIIDTAVTDKELQELRNQVPPTYIPDLKRWERKQSKDFYKGMIAGMNTIMRVMQTKMTDTDKRDYILKLTTDAGLIAGGFGKIIDGK